MFCHTAVRRQAGCFVPELLRVCGSKETVSVSSDVTMFLGILVQFLFIGEGNLEGFRV